MIEKEKMNEKNIESKEEIKKGRLVLAVMFPLLIAVSVIMAIVLKSVLLMSVITFALGVICLGITLFFGAIVLYNEFKWGNT